MIPFVTAREMSALDRKTMESKRISSYQLMDLATDALLEKILSDSRVRGSIGILCGPGNNGGDGYRLAEKLRSLKFRVWAYEVLEANSPDCRKAKKEFRGKIYKDQIPEADVFVDAIFGYSGRTDLPKVVLDSLRKVNRANAYRLSLDIPTGVSAEEGCAHPDSFYADRTLSIGFPKTVFILEEAAEFLGEVVHVGDFFSRPVSPKIFAIENRDFSFSKWPRAKYKSHFGKLGVIGGSPSMPGAAILAAEAGHRVGAGYASLFFARQGPLRMSIAKASFLYHQKWKWSDLKNQTALVMGPGGIPKSKIPYSRLSMPMVIDADAFSGWRGRAPKTAGPCLLTPHPGEAARLLGWSVEKIKANRQAALEALVTKTRQNVYLKGAPGLLMLWGDGVKSGCLGDGVKDLKCYVNLLINPVFSKAGSGDILAGILGGFLAQRPHEFKKSILSGLIFQSTVGHILREKRASLSSDQLDVFSEAFRRLKNAG